MPAYSKVASLVALLGLSSTLVQAYTLQDDYSGENFFSMFNFFTEEDPTHGYVDYVSQSAAQSAGLINTNSGQIYMGVDSTNVASGRGRKSVRLTSKATYNHALIILDLEHMPGSICGAWPAFWTVGPNWPASGEIDIIEGVNTQSQNAMTLHTGPGCSIGSATSPNTGSSNAGALFSGAVATTNCDVNAVGQATNAGCSIGTTDTSTYGDGLNAAKGGIYATEWTSDTIRTWYFPRGSEPSDIGTSPTPSTWGTPLSAFGSSSCDIDTVVKNQQIVFDTTFCGDWAGNVWSTDATCSKKAATCNDFVQNNPEAFAEAFWTVNSLKVFTGAGGAAPGASGSKSSGVPTATASRPPVASGSGSGTALPTGKPTVSGGVPSIPPVAPSSNIPGKPTTAPTPPAAQSATYQSPAWAGHTRSWTGWNGGGRGKWLSARSAPEQTAAPAPVSLPPPMVRRTEVPGADEDEIERVRRHILRHKRHHGGGL